MELAGAELTLVGDEFLGDDAGGVVLPDGIDELVWGREVLKVCVVGISCSSVVVTWVIEVSVTTFVVPAVVVISATS
jgi:hypothetical protein